jgi:hypothetical protein
LSSRVRLARSNSDHGSVGRHRQIDERCWRKTTPKVRSPRSPFLDSVAEVQGPTSVPLSASRVKHHARRPVLAPRPFEAEEVDVAADVAGDECTTINFGIAGKCGDQRLISISQTFSVLSNEAETARRPSGVTATPHTQLVCPGRVRSSRRLHIPHLNKSLPKTGGRLSA